LVVDGVTGLLVPPRNPDALAQAIIRLLRDPGLRCKMGRMGQERIAQHFAMVNLSIHPEPDPGSAVLRRCSFYRNLPFKASPFGI